MLLAIATTPSSSLLRRASAGALLLAATIAAPAQAQSTGHFKTVSGRATIDGFTACNASGTTVLARTCVRGSGSAELYARIDADLSLHARASVYESWIAESGHVAYADAAYFDRLTFAGDVIPSSVRFSMYLHGGAGNETSSGTLSLYHSASEPAYSISKWGIAWGGHGLPAGHFPTWPAPTTSVVRGSYDLPVIDGRVDFGLALRALAHLQMPLPDPDGTVHCGLPGGCTGLGVTSNFHETALLEMLAGIDANGEVITSGLQVQSASGHAYAFVGATLPTTTAPEPASVALVGTGLLGVVAAGARRRREILRS